MNIIQKIYSFIGRPGPTEQMVGALFDKTHASFERRGSRVLRNEGSKVDVAVFYSTGMPSRPDPYKVFVVHFPSKSIEEMDLNLQPQYAIRNYK